MDTFFVLLGLLVLAIPIVAIVALVKAVGLGEQLRHVDARLAAMERRVAPETVSPVPEPPPIAPQLVVEPPAGPN